MSAFFSSEFVLIADDFFEGSLVAYRKEQGQEILSQMSRGESFVREKASFFLQQILVCWRIKEQRDYFCK